MAKPNKQRLADHRKSREAQGMKRKELWVYPETWDEIKAFAQSKTQVREMCDQANRCDKIEDMFKNDIK